MRSDTPAATAARTWLTPIFIAPRISPRVFSVNFKCQSAITVVACALSPAFSRVEVLREHLIKRLVHLAPGLLAKFSPTRSPTSARSFDAKARNYCAWLRPGSCSGAQS